MCSFLHSIAAGHVVNGLRPDSIVLKQDIVLPCPELLEGCSMSEENELLRRQVDELKMVWQAERVAAKSKRVRRQLEEMWKAWNAERVA